MDDAAIILASESDPVLFESIFDRHDTTVLAFAGRRVGADAGEEVAARVFLIAFERRTSFDLHFRSAEPWLLGIASNLVSRYRRDEAMHLAALRQLAGRADELPVEDPDERLDAWRRRAALVGALSRLRREDRDTFLLHVLGELSYEDVARTLHIPVGTVRSRMHRSRKVLRECLGPDEVLDVSVGRT